MQKLLIPLLEANPEEACIVWTSSTSAENLKFSIDDIQGLQTRHSYESSKRCIDLITLGSHERYSNVAIYCTSPGCVASNILDGFLPVWVHALFLWVR